MNFHPSEDDWLLFIAEKTDPVYHTVAYLTKDNGGHWEEIETWVEKCIFGSSEDNTIDKEVIFCSSYANKKSQIRQDLLGGRSSAGNVLQLVSVKGKKIEPLLNDVIEFFMFSEFLAVAVVSIHNIYGNKTSKKRISDSKYVIMITQYRIIIIFFTFFF